MNSIIQSDLFRYEGKTGLKGLLKAFFIPGFKYTFFLRKSSSTNKYSLTGIFYRLMLRFYSVKYGFQISPKTKIGHGLYICHFGSLIINPKAIIGNNCNLTSGITIGQANRGTKKGYPVIGNKVWIGANCVIVGSVVIGDNVLIAPNSFVNFSVPDNSLVIGNPAKIIHQTNATEKYIEFILEESNIPEFLKQIKLLSE